MNTFKTALLLISFLALFACRTDDEQVVSTEITDSSITLEEAIQEITGGGSKTWKISKAHLLEDGETSVEITTLFNVQDDELLLSMTSDGSNGTLLWNRGFDINTNASTLENAASNIRRSNETFNLFIEETELGIEVYFENNRFKGLYDEATKTITGTLKHDPNAVEIEVTFTVKKASDYILAASSFTIVSELFSFTSEVNPMGFKVSQATNSLFITNRINRSDDGSQQAFKYDLTTGVLEELQFNRQDFATKNIEFIDNDIVSVGGIYHDTFQYDFASQPTHEFIEAASISHNNGSAALDNKVYIFGGVIAQQFRSWAIWEPGETSIFPNHISFDEDLYDTEGEIVNDKLYVFGGWSIIPGVPPRSSDKVYALNLNNGDLESISGLEGIHFAYTSIVEHLIYIGGRKAIDSNNDGAIDTYTSHFWVFNTLSNTLDEITLNNPLPENQQVVQLQVTKNKAFIVTADDQSEFRVYEVSLQ